MVEKSLVKKDYVEALDEIENQQFQLLQRKARFLQKELTKTNSQITDYEINSSNDSELNSHLNNKKHRQNSIKFNFNSNRNKLKKFGN